eukprot:1171599-Pyramimonas_sp.AAC.1
MGPVDDAPELAEPGRQAVRRRLRGPAPGKDPDMTGVVMDQDGQFGDGVGHLGEEAVTLRERLR